MRAKSARFNLYVMTLINKGFLQTIIQQIKNYIFLNLKNSKNSNFKMYCKTLIEKPKYFISQIVHVNIYIT